MSVGKAPTPASGRPPTATGAILRLLYHSCFVARAHVDHDNARRP